MSLYSIGLLKVFIFYIALHKKVWKPYYKVQMINQYHSRITDFYFQCVSSHLQLYLNMIYLQINLIFVSLKNLICFINFCLKKINILHFIYSVIKCITVIMLHYLQTICKKEGLTLPDELALIISQSCERNLRRAILMLEASKVKQLVLT